MVIRQILYKFGTWLANKGNPSQKSQRQATTYIASMGNPSWFYPLKKRGEYTPEQAADFILRHDEQGNRMTALLRLEMAYTAGWIDQWGRPV